MTPVEPIPGRGRHRGIAVVLSAPSELTWKKRQHLFGQEKDLLLSTLKIFGVREEDLYFTFAVPVLPEGKMPSIAEVQKWRNRLMSELDAVQPHKILIIGAAAYASLFDQSSLKNINDTRGIGRMAPIVHASQMTSVFSVTTIPPFYVTSDPDRFRDFVKDIEKLVTRDRPYEVPEIKYTRCRVVRDVETQLDILESASAVACDVESTGLDFHTDRLEALALAALAADGSLYTVVIPRELIYLEEVKARILKFLAGKDRIWHNMKFDVKMLMTYSGQSFFEHENFQDTILLSYLLDERAINEVATPHGLKSLSRVRYDVPDYKIDFKEFYALPEEERPYERLYSYAASDVAYTRLLWRDLLADIQADDPDLMEAYWSRLRPGTLALAEIEFEGADIDRNHLESLDTKLETDLDARLSLLKETMRQVDPDYGEFIDTFNPNSYVQVGEAVYDLMQIPDSTKNKRPTDKETLSLMAYELKTSGDLVRSQFLLDILKFREVYRARSNYVQGMLSRLTPENKVHGEFNPNGTTTGRLSSQNPNLQNQPTLMGPMIRQAFVAPTGFKFVEIDYSQLELRVAAWYSRDEIMIRAYRDNRDIHKEVASSAFQVPYELVTYDQRYAAKYIDFGILYGRTAASLVAGLELIEYGWTIEQAQGFIDNFLGGFPGLKAWIEEQHELVRKHHQVKQPTGRIRRWPFVPNRSFARSMERQAVNTPIQGLASDFTFGALIELHRRLKKGYRSRIVLTVHDSIGLKIADDEVDEVCALARDIMLNELPVAFDIPLKVDIEIGPNWGALETWQPKSA